MLSCSSLLSLATYNDSTLFKGGIRLPDIFTHLLFGIALELIWNPESREEGMLIVMGAVLTDVERPFTLLLDLLGFSWLNLVAAFHSFLATLFLVFAASSCFEMKHADFWSRFRLIEGSCILHLLLDLTMYVWEELGYYLLYPLKIRFSFHLVWSGFVWFPFVGVLAVTLAGGWWWITEKLAVPTN